MEQKLEYTCEGIQKEQDNKVNQLNHHQSNHLKIELMILMTSNEKTAQTIKGNVDLPKETAKFKAMLQELPNSDVPPYLGYSLGKEAKNMGLSI